MKIILVVMLFTLVGCADYMYQRGCNPPLGGMFKCK